MTWDEFKKMVDTYLAEHGLTGAIRIDYIDWSHYPPPQAYVDEFGLAVH